MTNISTLHKLYCSLANIPERQCGLSMGRIWAWEAWLLQFTESDLRLVIAHTHRFNRRNPDRQRSFHFNNVIVNRDKFRDWLEEAQSEQRARQAKLRRLTMDRNRAEVLRTTGREDELPLADSRTSAQILRGNSFFEAMRKAVEAGTGGVSV